VLERSISDGGHKGPPGGGGMQVIRLHSAAFRIYDSSATRSTSATDSAGGSARDRN
jgi:hypothetical protein